MRVRTAFAALLTAAVGTISTHTSSAAASPGATPAAPAGSQSSPAQEIPSPRPARRASTSPATNAQIPDPASGLGVSWQQSSDALVTGIGDDGGFHVYIARERDAFRWTMLATLRLPGWDSGPWTGYTCVTGSGRYAVAVYAPSFAVNKPELVEAGAFASVIDTRTGAVRPVASGVALQYFSPSCGTGDDVLLTRAIGADEQETDLLRVDAAAGRVVRTTHVDAQVTTPAPAPDGDYAIVRGHLVRIDPTGRLHELATPEGQPFALHTAGRAGLDMLTVRGDRTIAERWSGGYLSPIGEADKGRLQLFGSRGGGDILVGQTAAIRTAVVPGLVTIPLTGRAAAVSADGHLVALSVEATRLRDEITSGPQSESVEPGRLRVTTLATHSGRRVTSDVVASHGATVSSPIAPTAPGSPSPHAVTPNENPPLDPTETNPECAVPRNDIHRQVLQPTAPMVEWAVDQAVHGDLTIGRQADYLHTGEPAYTPQGMFPPAPLVTGGGDEVPAQVMLGVLAQETNFRQATFHARPGDGGNPFIADYYGSEPFDDFINYTLSDCGYGISQVTDGMQLGDTQFTSAQQVAIATDYAANIAAGLQILAGKWNQLADAGLVVNNGDSSYIENWFLALWAYNSGYHPPDSNGNSGVGWFNNPANPQYPADRDPFLRDTTADASHPADWSYEEKVMGWIESPQHTYFDTPSYETPTFGPSGHLDLPSQTAFCSPTVNSCDPSNRANPCPSDDSFCWWDGFTTWTACTQECATEKLDFGLGAVEPPMEPQYTPDCDPPSTAPGVIIVDDLPDSGVNVVGCDSHQSGGKFTIRTGDDEGDSSLNAQIDLHQLGAAYGGHMWFTHTYPAADVNQLVTATWTPDGITPNGQSYDIFAHMPDHGGAADATYHFDLGGGVGEFTGSSVVSQNTQGNEWVAIGQFFLKPGARVQLQNNTGGDGTEDIAFDALEFVPLPAAPVLGLDGQSGTLPPAAISGGRDRTRAQRKRNRRTSR